MRRPSIRFTASASGCCGTGRSRPATCSTRSWSPTRRRLLRQLVEDYWRKQFYRAGKIPVIFALKNGLSPEGLLPLVRTSLPHPFLKLLSPVDGQTPDSLAAALEAAFASLREVWRAEKDAIRGHFGSGAKWANKPYNDDEAMADAFRQLDIASVPRSFRRPHWMPCSCSASRPLRQKVSKKAKLPVPAHPFFDLCEELARAEEHYVIGRQARGAALCAAGTAAPEGRAEDPVLRRPADAPAQRPGGHRRPGAGRHCCGGNTWRPSSTNSRTPTPCSMTSSRACSRGRRTTCS